MNSVDPHCITIDALNCLPCKNYASCAVCAPGWDNGCISIEPHKDTTCTEADIVAPNNRSVLISYLMNGECVYHAVMYIFIHTQHIFFCIILVYSGDI